MSDKIAMIRRLREETGLGLVEAKRAMDEAGNYDAAVSLLRSRGVKRIKPNRVTNRGLVEVYTHQGRIGAMVEVLCETDFVARTDGFKELSREIAMQVASMAPCSLTDLLAQAYIRDSSLSVSELIQRFAAQCGENIRVNRFQRFELNDSAPSGDHHSKGGEDT